MHAQCSQVTHLGELDSAIQNLCEHIGDSKHGKTVLFGICILLVREMKKGLPTTLCQAWATQLYELADTLAVDGDAPRT